jgi:protein TonB
VKPLLASLKSLSTLQWALVVSLGLHASLLTVRFVAPEHFNRVFQDTPLEVILVNAKSNEKPEKAQAIAQASLAGGGESKSKVRATSPLPTEAIAKLGDSAESQEERRIRELKELQNQVLSQVRQQLATMPPPDLQSITPSEEAIERELKRQALIKSIAEIEKRINEENSRPRKRFISPSTREEVYAIYYDSLRRKIEDRGTTNFPEASGRKLYGELTMAITVNFTGVVLDTEVVQTSGNILLDRRAQAIVKSLEFGNFNEGMRRQADQIVVVSRFRFTREAGLKTQISSH